MVYIVFTTILVAICCGFYFLYRYDKTFRDNLKVGQYVRVSGMDEWHGTIVQIIGDSVWVDDGKQVYTVNIYFIHRP